jgi:hypothetical protein
LALDACAVDGATPQLLHATYKPLLRWAAVLRRLTQFDASASSGSHAVVLVTAPTHLLPLPVAAQLRSYFDLVIKVHAFTDPAAGLAVSRESAAAMPPGAAAGTAPEFAEYTGLVLLRRLPRLGALASFQPDTLTYAFKRDRRKLTIEKPHLPPEDDRTAGTAAPRPQAQATAPMAPPVVQQVVALPQAAAPPSNVSVAAPAASARGTRLRAGGSLSASLSLAGLGGPVPGESRSGLRGLLLQDEDEELAAAEAAGVTQGGRRPPLQPGMACATGLGGARGGKSSLDF